MDFIPKGSTAGKLQDYVAVFSLVENRRLNELCDAEGALLPGQYDGQSGFAYFDLADLVAGRAVTPVKLAVGSVDQGKSYSNPCAFGNTYRSQKRGGQFVATVAHHPFPSLGIVDGSKLSSTSKQLPGGRRETFQMVATGSKPQRVAYAPAPRAKAKEASSAAGRAPGLLLTLFGATMAATTSAFTPSARVAATAVFALALLQPTQAVFIGDEHLVARSPGKFYSFGENEIAIIDPVSGVVTKTLVVETTRWSDTVYMERGDLHYIFANDRGNHEVVVIDTVKEEVVHRVALADGANVVHSYGVHWLDTFFTHSDGLGYFDTIHLDSPRDLHDVKVPAKEATAGHGKLLFHEDLGSRAFVTNVNEPILLEIDLLTRETVRTHRFDEAANFDCKGTHSIAYSPANKHVYAQCSGGSSGTVEINTQTNEIVKKWTWPDDGNPTPYTAPHDEFIVLVDKKESTVHVLQARAGSATKEFAPVVFADADGTKWHPVPTRVCV